MTESIETFQIPIEAAECYEAEFVPAFFAQWAPILCTAAGVTAGHAVLDVGCGTGIVARAAADLVAPSGSVTGLDLNEAMLTVASRVRPDLAWRQGDACALPFEDQSFDVVLSQMALMFVPDRIGALREMGRVVRQGGTVGLLVPSELERQVAFAPFLDLAARHAGPDARSLLSSYFVCGDLDTLTAVVEAAGLRVTSSRVETGSYTAPSIDAAVTNEIESTPLRERISDDVYERIREEARELFSPYTTEDGRLSTPFDTNLVVARRP
jgi:ubiquinone/menaquinone biosynthesis C-methylase UbiE